MGVPLFIIRLLLGAVFGLAGVAKFADRPGTRQAIVDFGLPAKLGAPLGTLLPPVEVAVALALLRASSAWWGALGALMLLLLFIAAIGFNLVRGRQPDCHCFGQIHAAPAGWRTLLRNGLLAALAGFVVWQGHPNVEPDALAWLGAVSVGQAVLLTGSMIVLTLLVLQGWLLVNLLRQNGRLLLRIEALEAQMGRPADDPSRVLTQEQPQAIRIGEPVPALTLPDLTGTPIDLADFRGNTTLVLFWNPDCGYCRRMLDDLKAWEQQRRRGLPQLLVISRGSVAANAAMGLQSPILLDQNFDVAQAFGADGTPAGVLIDAQGQVAAELAVGTPAVRALVGASMGRAHSAGR